MKNIIDSTSNKVDSIIPAEKFDFKKSQIESIGMLNDTDRLDFSERLLNKELTPDQQEAIITAHKV
tara:strand:+ start:450 stop:647 length:198 start_codon:yes stop_codon:yes gene_type:complete